MAEQDEVAEAAATPGEQGDVWTRKSHDETPTIGIEYAKNWKMTDAFREFLLNWADAIIKTFSVSMENLIYVHEIPANGYKITVHHPETRKILGFLHFDKSKGRLELCNYESQLSRKALQMGWTDKDSRDDLSGEYGEGLKIAALVMLRAGSYQIKIAASGYYWRFQWQKNDKTAVTCVVTKVGAKDGNKESPQNRDETHFRLPSSSQDVSVKIGTVYGNSGSPLTEKQAKKLLNIYLYFNRFGPQEIIKTKYGAVILKKELSGKIYLKGVFWGKAPSSHLYKYGYDFYRGRLDRDKKWDSSQLPDWLMEVWGEAVKCGGNNIDTYLGLFQNTEQNWLDIEGASTRMSGTVAKSLWNRLQEKNPQGTKFYHVKSGSDKKIQSILKKKPVPLPEKLWKPLRKHTSVKTQLEYRMEKFIGSNTVKIPDTPYCQSFLWILRAALSLHNKINFEIVFKDGYDIDVDICLDVKPDKSRFLLHQRYMSFEQIHRDKGMECTLSQARSSNCVVKVENFTCEHIIDYLHDRTLDELDRNKITTGISIADEERGDSSLALEIRKCLKHMPRMIRISHGRNNGELRVSWEDSEAGAFSRVHNIGLESHVILHRDSTCRHKRSEQVARRDKASNDETADIANCGCPQKMVSSTSSDYEIIFEGLVSTESYFPKISRAKALIAFFGFPPSSMKPTSNKSPTRMLATVHKTENEDIPKTNMFTATSNTDSEGNLPVDKALYAPPCKSLRDRMSYNVTSVEARLEKSEACRKILRQDVEKASTRVKELESNFDSLKNEKESLSNQIRDAQSEKARLKKSCELLEAQKMSNATKSQAATDALGVKIGDLNVKIADLERELTKTRKSHKTQAIELEISKKELDVMKSENAVLQEKLSGLLIKSSATVDLKKAQATIDKLQKKHGELKMEIGQQIADRERLEEKIVQANELVERANMERNQAMAEKTDAIEERDEAIVQKNKAVKAERASRSLLQIAWEENKSSDEGSRHAPGTKRGRSPDPKEQNAVHDGVGSGSRSVKKVKRETAKIIELD